MSNINIFKKATLSAAISLTFAASLSAQAETVKIVDFSFGEKTGAMLLEKDGSNLEKLIIHEPIGTDVKLEKLQPTRRASTGTTSFKWLFIELIRLESRDFNVRSGGEIDFIVPKKLSETNKEITIDAELTQAHDGSWYFEHNNEVVYSLAIKRSANGKKVSSFDISTLGCNRDSIEAYAEKTKSVDLLEVLDCDSDVELAALTYLKFVAPDLVNSAEGRSLKTHQIQKHRDAILKLAANSSDYEVQQLIQEATSRGYLEVADTLIQD